MRLVLDALYVPPTLAKNKSISQTSPAGGDMNRSSTSEIKGWEIEEPAIGIPCPIGDGTVHNSGEEEAENDGWNDTATLEGASDHDHDRACAEDELVKAEHDIWYDCGADRRRGRNVLETEV